MFDFVLFFGSLLFCSYFRFWPFCVVFVQEGLSKEQLATLLEEEKAGKPAAAPAPAAAAKA